MSKKRIRLVNQKIKVGVIGLGGAGRAHVRRLNRNPFVSRVYGYDIKKITGIAQVEIVKTLEDLLSKVDAVTICTPDDVHFENIVASLNAGKHVLSEKPMVASFLEAKKLEPYIKKYKHLIFGVHHQMRSNPVFSKAKDLINSGKLGKIFYIETNYWHNMKDRAKMFDNWRQEKGQSLIFAHACHPLDFIMYLTGTSPVNHHTFLSKNAFSEYNAVYTSATSILNFSNGIVAKCHVNSFCVYPQLNDILVMGDKATYIDGVLYKAGQGFNQMENFFGKSGWFNTEMIITNIGIQKKLLSFFINLYMRTLNSLLNLYINIGSHVSSKFMKEIDFGFRRNPLTIYNHDLACQMVIDNFIDSVRGEAEIMTNYEDAKRVISLCEDLEKDGLKEMKRKAINK